MSTTTLLHARDRGRIPSIVREGARSYPWPRARDEYLAHAKLNKPDAGTGGMPGPIRMPDRGEDLKKENWVESSFNDPLSAAANKNVYSAALLQLEYEQRIGNLVPRDVVDATWTGAGEAMKKAMLSIPDRIAPQFGGENHHKLYRALVEEITHALSAMEVVYDFPEIRKNGRPVGR